MPLPKVHLSSADPILSSRVFVLGLILTTLALPFVCAPIDGNGITPLDITFTVTTTATNTTTLASGELSMITFVRTLTRHNFTRYASVTAHVAANIGSTTILTDHVSPSTNLILTIVGAFVGAIILIVVLIHTRIRGRNRGKPSFHGEVTKKLQNEALF